MQLYIFFLFFSLLYVPKTNRLYVASTKTYKHIWKINYGKMRSYEMHCLLHFTLKEKQFLARHYSKLIVVSIWILIILIVDLGHVYLEMKSFPLRYFHELSKILLWDFNVLFLQIVAVFKLSLFFFPNIASSVVQFSI